MSSSPAREPSDTPERSDVVEDDDDVLADEGGPRPNGRFRRLQRRGSIDK
jgi:hypothetical protein